MQFNVHHATEIKMSKDLRTSQMRRAAELYYEQSLSQNDIAKIMGCSTATVSRLLAGAQDCGIVKFHIERRGERVPELSRQLRDRFGIREAVVVPSSGSADSDLRAVGEAAAELLLSAIESHSKIGVTWGQTLAHMVQALYAVGREPVNLAGIEVCQLSGSLGQGNPEVDGPQLALRLADFFGGVCHLVPAPAVVDSAELCRALLKQPQITTSLNRASHLDIVVQGIGALDPTVSSLTRAGYLSEAEGRAAIEVGAVGHVFARMIDAQGHEVGDWGQRVIAVPLDTIRRARLSIGISASVAKVPAILAALRAGYFNTLVVDEVSARQVLQLAVAANDAPVLKERIA
ncbi:MAG: sugar-binding transcriptional regulator [Steroidobacteraceae bacterium]|nr:sugar-binding transcriptional regulator [Steroidobacteraceae bacterium]